SQDISKRLNVVLRHRAAWTAPLTGCDRLPSMVTVSDQAKPASKGQVKTGYLEYGPGSLVSRGTSCSGWGRRWWSRSALWPLSSMEPFRSWAGLPGGDCHPGLSRPYDARHRRWFRLDWS